MLSGDVNGGNASAAGHLDADAAYKNYFTLLLAAHKELSAAQFGSYFPKNTPALRCAACRFTGGEGVISEPI